jgi:RNA polymerase sigma factor (sigma-70 family)
MRALDRLLLLAVAVVLAAAGAITAIELVAAAANSHELLVPYLHWWSISDSARRPIGWRSESRSIVGSPSTSHRTYSPRSGATPADSTRGAGASRTGFLRSPTTKRSTSFEPSKYAGRTESDAQINQIADESIDLPAGAWQAEQRNHALSALARLNDVQRQVIELAYFEGHSQRQVAEILDLPLGTIKSRTQTALANLRISLESAGMA